MTYQGQELQLILPARLSDGSTRGQPAHRSHTSWTILWVKSLCPADGTDWFDCLDSKHRPILNDREIFDILRAVVTDADKVPVQQVAPNALGILTTESRKIWSHLRTELIKSNKNNASSLAVVESALFVLCLDDAEPEDLASLCGNFLCGGYKLEGGVQVGTCTNRWYDKVSLVCTLRATSLLSATNHCLLKW